MGNYFYVHFLESKNGGIAYDKCKDLFYLPESGELKNWKNKKLVLRGGIFEDYQGNDMGSRLCSEKFQKILEDNKDKSDEIQWLAADIIDGKQSRRYWILHFTNPPDIISREKSLLNGDSVVVAVIALNKINKHQVSSFKGAGQTRFFVSEKVKKEIQKMKCSGVTFSKMPTWKS